VRTQKNGSQSRYAAAPNRDMTTIIRRIEARDKPVALSSFREANNNDILGVKAITLFDVSWDEAG
jgi:hypothetical protein